MNDPLTVQSRHPPRAAPRVVADPTAASPRVERTARAAARTELTFKLDRETGRLVVAVVDRANGAVVRTFPLVLPGFGSDESRRGALIDAKA